MSYILIYSSGMSFPFSFPYEWMHLIYGNLLPNLILFWTDDFKDIDYDAQDYHLLNTVWETIWRISKQAGDTIPSAYGPHMPKSSADSIPWTSSIMSFWAHFLAPTLLQQQLHTRYHTHFVELVKLMNICLKYNMKTTDIDIIQEGFAKWVIDYEKYIYPCSLMI
jgi:hypothetical protein